MKHLVITLLLTTFCFSQSNSRWKDHFSYANVSNMLEVNGDIICSTENGLFSYNPTLGELQKISKVNELNDVGITALAYNEENNIIFIGYRSGELDILGEDENHNFLEIPLHNYNGDKRVNHISTYQNTAVLSGEFGLATFNLVDLEFEETTYFLNNGVHFGVKEAIIVNDIIYAVSSNGVYFHNYDSFTPNFLSWQQPSGLPVNSYEQIVNFQETVVVSSGGNVFAFDGNSWNWISNFGDIKNLNVNNNVLSITLTNQVINLDTNFNVIETISFDEELNNSIKYNNTTYGGSKKYGMIESSTNNEIYPDGPFTNSSWSLAAQGGQLFIAPGRMRNFNAPSENADGYSHFNGTQWIHNSSEELLDAKDVVDITINPSDSTEVYVSTWFEFNNWTEQQNRGLFQMKSGEIEEHYITTNSSLKNRLRIAGCDFDEEGNLWVTQSHVETGSIHGLSKRTPNGQWTYFSISTSQTGGGIRKPTMHQGYAWIPGVIKAGVMVTNMQDTYTILQTEGQGNLPSASVISLAIDDDGVLWIGTDLGLRVLYNPLESLISGNYETEPIVIEQNGVPEALLTDVQINDIEVDDANRKWIATGSSGAFYFSEDGTETIYNFTSSNSPLPSNSVSDIEVDKSTGEVYFATEYGVVSFRGDVLDTGDSFGDVYAYPNPVRPGFTSNVIIRGLPNDADVRITDVVGNLLHATKASGGVAEWDTTNLKGKLVASGVYIVMMTNKDASETKQTKIAIVR